jgi:predicted Zn-dependent peptidase
VHQEIREYRSMAYAASGVYRTPVIEHKPAHFLGYIGTQADKTIDAIDVYMNLLTDMPLYPDRINYIKSYLKGVAQTEKPQFRSASELYNAWELRGYTESPAKTNQNAVNNLTFEDIVKFYNDNIKGRPMAIAITGNPKMIDEKALAKYGKVVRLTTSKVFSDK